MATEQQPHKQRNTQQPDKGDQIRDSPDAIVTGPLVGFTHEENDSAPRRTDAISQIVGQCPNLRSHGCKSRSFPYRGMRCKCAWNCDWSASWPILVNKLNPFASSTSMNARPARCEASIIDALSWRCALGMTKQCPLVMGSRSINTTTSCDSKSTSAFTVPATIPQKVHATGARLPTDGASLGAFV
jgi:hypothetical protein